MITLIVNVQKIKKHNMRPNKYLLIYFMLPINSLPYGLPKWFILSNFRNKDIIIVHIFLSTIYIRMTNVFTNDNMW